MKIEQIEKILYKLLKKAEKKEEVPVAAIIIKNGKILSKAYNKVNKKNNILNHAEILAIRKSSKKIKNWRLNECELFVTLEPCSMCREIIKKSRIKKVTYFSKQNNYQTEIHPQYNFIFNEHFSNILINFFKEKR